MKFSSLFVSVLFLLSGVQALACGDGTGCTAGFEKGDDGSYHVKNFRQSSLGGSDWIPAYTGNVYELIPIYNVDGSKDVPTEWMVVDPNMDATFRPVAPRTLQGSPAEVIPIRKYWEGSSSTNYVYYVRRSSLLGDNVSDSYNPGGITVRPSTACTGSCKKVIGNFDSVAQDVDALYVSGWACDRATNKSIAVHIYAGGPAGTGKIIGSGTANLKLKDAAKINALCGTTVGHRFRVKIPLKVVNANRGKKLYVHGISATGGPNLTISRSGAITIPSPKVKGYIDGLTIANWTSTDPSKRQVRIRGWACQEGIAKSINVHVYAGGPAGDGGTLVAQPATANLDSEIGVANECATGFRKYRFNVLLNWGSVYTQAGKRLYVHGISTNGTPNYTIERSGKFSIPKSSLCGSSSCQDASAAEAKTLKETVQFQ